MKNRVVGLLLSLVLAAVMFLLTFGLGPLSKLNSNLTSNGGDALKDVYTTYYNAKFDTSFVRNNAMNYPYGDHYTYTGDQIFVSWPIRVAKNIGLGDFSDNVVGCVNFFVLASVFLCVIFLFLLFVEVKLPIWLSAVGAVLITFLSPQMGRIPAHLTLSYAYLIPLMLYLFLRFYRKPSFWCSLFIGVTLFVCGISHPYYMVFFAVIFGLFWIYILLNERERVGNVRSIIFAVLLQFLIPLVCFFLLTKVGDLATDRTKIPWGFYAYRGRIEGVIFPYLRSYFHIPSFLPRIGWGTVAYIGLAADIAFFVILYKVVKRLVARNYSLALQVSDDKMLNLFFWAAIILLLSSILLPLLPERILNYVGILAQMRGMSRFMWLFYYVINILVFYWLAKFMVKGARHSWVNYAVLVAVLFCYAFESYKYASSLKIENNFPEIFDHSNTLPQNQWVKELNADDYQSILALPYFNLGSEHVWIDPCDGMFNSGVYVSLKTGLPMHNNMTSRSSISQTYRNAALMWEPFEQYRVLNDLKSSSPILTITREGKNSLNGNELRIVKHSTFLFAANGLNFYRTEVDSLVSLCRQYSAELYQMYSSNRLFAKATGVFCNDTAMNFYFQSWDSLPSSKTYQGKGALQGVINKRTSLYRGKCPVEADSVEISFMMGANYTQDLYGRSKLEISTTTADGKKVFHYKSDVFRRVVNVVDDWALVRLSIPILTNTGELSILVRNKAMLGKPVFFDNLTIKPVGMNVVVETEGKKTLNNVPVLHVATEAEMLMPIDTVLFKPRRKIANDDISELVRLNVVRIKSSPEWMQSIKEKAKERNISVDSMVVIDAIYMATH